MMKHKKIGTLLFAMIVGVASALHAQVPVITNVPDAVSAGETIKIVGTNLEVTGKPTRVRLSWPTVSEANEESLPVKSQSATVITATMPEFDYDDEILLKVSTDETSAAKKIRYKSKLHVDRVVPSPGTSADEVEIIGRKFQFKDPAGNVLPAMISLSWTESTGLQHTISLQAPPQETSIVFPLPAIEYAGDIRLKVRIGDKESNETVSTVKDLRSRKPATIEVINPPKPTSGEAINIVGKDFIPNAETEVILKYTSDRGAETLVGKIITDNSSQLKYVIPNGFEPGGDIKISVKNQGTVASNEKTIQINGNLVRFDFRTGFQSSTISKKDDANEKLFQDNRLFYDFIATMRASRHVDIQTRLTMGRSVVEGEAEGTTNTQKIIANAESAEGELSLVVKDPLVLLRKIFNRDSSSNAHNGYRGYYLRPAFGFLATNDSQVTDDLYYDKSIVLGYEPQVDRGSKFAGSKLEAGYKYTDSFTHEDRFASMLRLAYNIKGVNPAPFIDFKINAGKGPDDLTVMYGVMLDIDPIFESISKLFSKGDAVQ